MTEPNVRPQDSSSDPIWLNNNRSDRVQEYANKRHANGDHIGMDQPHGGRSLQPPCNPNDLPLPYHNEHNTTHHRISNATPYSVNISPSDHSVHAIIGATASEDSVEGFFGSSSAGTFMQNVQKIVQQQVGRVEDPNQTFQPQDRVSITIPASGRAGVKSTSIDYVLPPRRRADFLLSLYWQYIHVLYPYLDKKQMDDDYKKLWNSGDSVVHEQSFVCLLNVIFALTCQIDTSTAVKERGKCADEFYRRARALLDIVDMGSVRSVQTFLLLGQYFQSTNEPHPCWVFTGLAIRTAQSLGLNLAETSERANDPQYRQHLRRVWYGCVLMDRVTAMTYGRPCMIGPRAAAAVPYPEPALEGQHDLQLPLNSSARGGADVEFFVFSLKLYEILHDILYSFYSVNSLYTRLSSLETNLESIGKLHARILEVDSRLASWQQSLPRYLNLSEQALADSDHPILHRQACILHQRQLHVRALLLRPVLSRFIASGHRNVDDSKSVSLDSLLAHRVTIQCAIVCVKVAMEIVDTVHTGSSSDPRDVGYLAAWWYNVLYLYTSATVLIAARLSSVIVEEIGENNILLAWKNAINLLKGYNTFTVTVQRLTATLQLLSETLPQQYAGPKGAARPEQRAESSEEHDPDPISLPQWRLHDTVDFASGEELSAFAAPHGSNRLRNEFSFDPMLGFDPNDLSWLMTIPLDHMYGDLG